MVAHAVKQNTLFQEELFEADLPEENLAVLSESPQQTDDLLNENVHDTIDLFGRLSQRLTESYQALEGRVFDLQGELKETDNRREKEATQKRQLAGRLECILEAMPAGVVILDGSGRVDQANRAARDMLGEPLEGQPWIGVIRRCFSPTAFDGHEISLKDGRFVSLATQSLDDEPGQIIVINDMTETRVLQDKVNHNRKLSEMGRMTASLAHQVRTPLSTAILYADHLDNDGLDASRKKRYIEKLKERLHQLESQVNDMLIFSKEGIVINQVVDVNWFLEELIRRHSDIALQQGVIFQLEAFSKKCQLRCNIDLLISAYGNLIDNAIQTLLDSPHKPKIIILSAECVDENTVAIAVNDNGEGIAEDALHRVKEPFFTTKSTGTGLGLSVVQLIAKSHGANFNIVNRQQGGLSVSLAFPVISQ